MKAVAKVEASLQRSVEALNLNGKPIEQWTTGELLVDNARLAMHRIREMVERPNSMSDERPAWEQRLIVDTSMAVAKLLATVQTEQLRARRDEAQFGAFMATVDAFETQLYGSVKERKASVSAQAEKAKK